ncbi:hypothetical protein PVAR5_2007 [Paecilomyces variotii No. 5]|uniref:F-box domain-containing protein n=1 Tax=Byssochlamys spectabilis (strain No. 5 / NBRC 109023) TaxID=1356009 RepID=V5FXQ5_BYSSN|nr:hypothetical protein PVAR5_2007 [Paecilomyces variotii No. 5]
MVATLEEAMERVSLQESKGQTTRKKKNEPSAPFRFFDLPSEIRLRIYHLVLFTPRNRNITRRSTRWFPTRSNGNVGSSARGRPIAPASQRISLFLASRRMHDEAAHYFYSVQTFRIFPVQDYNRMPTIRALSPRYRAMVSTIELILGSSWTAPPKSWAVNKSLGLQDMVTMRMVKVFIQCDPSHPAFEGFRISRDYYTSFAGDLLRQILQSLPSVSEVEFDGWPSVDKHGPLMNRLLLETRLERKKIHWGPERGWSDFDDGYESEEEEAPASDLDPDQLMRGMHGGRLVET